MATQHGLLSITIVDDLSVGATHDIFVSLDDTTTLASIISQAQAYWTLVKPLTDGMSTKCSITVNLTPADFNAAPATGKAVDTTGLFTFAQSGSPYKYSVDIPCIADAIISGSKIDNANSDVTDWVEWWASAHSGVRGESKYRLLTAGFLQSNIGTRKHRKALSRKSTNPVTS